MAVIGCHRTTNGNRMEYAKGVPIPWGATAVNVPMLTPTRIARKT